jgi:geranylgeranyl diphosphate synthase type II
MNGDDIFAHDKKLVDAALARYLPEHAAPENITKAMRYSLFAGGKRLRPKLILIAYRTIGGRKIEDVLPAACAVEMIHTYSLIHDDLPSMDDDDFRRGKPSCHKAFGEAMAILAGDALFARAYEILLRTKTSPENLLYITKLLTSVVGIDGIIGGQVMDILSNADSKDEELLKYIHTHKTAKFISACLVIGSLLADAYKEELRALKKIGDALGLAFQIVDDVLDVKSTKTDMGKSVHKDEAQSKLTYPAVYGLDESIEKAQKLLKRSRSIMKRELKFRDVTELEQIAEFIVSRVH